MEKFNLEVVDMPIAVESRGVTFTGQLSALPHDILRQLIPHAIKQKLADAVSGTPLACYMASKPEGTPKPSRDQLTDWIATNKKSVDDALFAGMAKAWDAMVENRWVVRVAGEGTSSKWSDEQGLAIDIAKGVLKTVFTNALAKAKPNAKPTAAEFVALSPKVAAFFKANESRPTWDDKAVMAWAEKQAESKVRDYMAEAREELARRATALADAPALDDMLADL